MWSKHVLGPSLTQFWAYKSEQNGILTSALLELISSTKIACRKIYFAVHAIAVIMARCAQEIKCRFEHRRKSLVKQILVNCRQLPRVSETVNLARIGHRDESPLLLRV
jgi:hypothetical protein